MLFEDWIVLPPVPPWLAGPWGEKWLKTWGTLKDVLVDGCKQAVKARFVKYCPVDALQYIGSERGIERAPGETDASYRQRLATAWDVWTFSGAAPSIKTSLAAFGITISKIWVFDTPAFGWDNDDYWSRFWIVVESGGHPWTQPIFDDGGTWDDPGGTWDSSATVDEIGALRRVIRKFKSAHSYPVAIFLEMSAGVWGPGYYDDGGTWGSDTTAPIMWLLGHTWNEEAHWGGTDGIWDDAGTYDGIIT